MRVDAKKKDIVLLIFIVLVFVALPFGIRAYDHLLAPREIPPGARAFTLTGNAEKGWLLGEIQANDIVSLWKKNGPNEKPVLEVFEGDLVLLKLRSSDVTHGFSLKDFGVYIASGIKPGKTIYVSFKADKVGTYVFTCNVFCGDIHPHMQGTLVVKARPINPEAT
jgi:heme/copper-type cytochrome/quinol oxidase subunit 2